MFASLVVVNANAEARSDMKLLPLFPAVDAFASLPLAPPACDACAFEPDDWPSVELPILLEKGTIELPANPVACGAIGARVSICPPSCCCCCWCCILFDIDLCMASSNKEGPAGACFFGRRSEGRANGLLVPVA